jgi:hypothetical protein
MPGLTMSSLVLLKNILKLDKETHSCIKAFRPDILFSGGEEENDYL